MRVLAAVLLFVSAALAYQVTSPGQDQDWTTSGPNVLKWERVSTDPTTFAVMLSNQSPGLNLDLLIASNVDGTTGSFQCPTPDGGWPTGSGFRVNLVADAQHPDSLLAQSGQFNITGTSSSTTTGTSATATSSGSTSSGTSTQSKTSSSTGSATTSNPTSTSTSAALVGTSTNGLFAALAALSAVLFTGF